MSVRRHNRRSTRPLEDLPSLFAEPPDELLALGGEVRPDTGTAADYSLDPAEMAPDMPQLLFMSFGSGSSGNCSFVGTHSAGILIDGGVDNNFVTDRLLHSGIDMSAIQGILLTHDHADHVRFAYALLRRNPHMRLYATPRVLEGILRRHNISRRIKDYHAPIYKEHTYTFGPMTVIPFETSHDGTDNAGFAITCGPTTLVIATDMGCVTERADYYIRQATALVIEANYDSGMLERGRYPEYLKSRIRSPRGHMDNAETARYLADILVPGKLRSVFLCHLSNDNNTPELALDEVGKALRGRGVSLAECHATMSLDSTEIYLTALPRYETSLLYRL